MSNDGRAKSAALRRNRADPHALVPIAEFNWGSAIVKVVSCRPAWVKTSNRFTNLFAQAVQDAGWDVREFSWTGRGLFGPRVILIHWPDDFFIAQGFAANAKALAKLALLQTARKFLGVRLVWVVHETHPHDIGRPGRWSTGAFLAALDGVIYLSHASKRSAESDIPELARVPALVTRHGHYRPDMQKPPEFRRTTGKRLKLAYFGQIRPYKNLDNLIRAARNFSPDEIELKLIGWSKDPAFSKSLADLAADAPAVKLDIRDRLVPQVDIEAALDESDGVVLPYRKILNSGAALFALSRNRPILAPRLGTLPELQDEIGRDWVDLYDDDIAEQDLRDFAARLREPGPPVVDLSAYEWGPIGESIGGFFDQLSDATRRSRARQFEPGSARS
jgi:glycosyltransferase involved in cell wall biosynthesis